MRPKFERLVTENDRDADNFYPLLAVAAFAGPRWEAIIRDAAREIAKGVISREDLSTQLLRDLYKVFTAAKKDSLLTAEIIDGLTEIEDGPWKEMFPSRKPITSEKLGHMLRSFGIKSKKLKGGKPRGYDRADFERLWKRYKDSRYYEEVVDEKPADEEQPLLTILDSELEKARPQSPDF